MGLILKLAWRNLWRNKRRSFIVIAAIVSGLWGMVLMIAISEGMIQEMVKTSIESGVGHVQVHRKGFMDNIDVHKNIRDPGYFANKIEAAPHITAYARRIKVMGLVSSPEASSGILVWGIDSGAEPAVSAVKRWLADGAFLSGVHGEIYIGRSLADKLKVDLDDKIVLMAQGLSHGNRVGCLPRGGDLRIKLARIRQIQRLYQSYRRPGTPLHDEQGLRDCHYCRRH